MSGDPRSQILLNQIGTLRDVVRLPQVRFTRGPPLRRPRRNALGRGGGVPDEGFVDYPDDSTPPEAMEGVDSGPALDMMQESLPAHAEQPMMAVESEKERRARIRMEQKAARKEAQIQKRNEQERIKAQKAEDQRRLKALENEPLMEMDRPQRVDPNVRRVLPPEPIMDTSDAPERLAIEHTKEVARRNAPEPIMDTSDAPERLAIEHTKEIAMRDAPGAVVHAPDPRPTGLFQGFLEALINKPINMAVDDESNMIEGGAEWGRKQIGFGRTASGRRKPLRPIFAPPQRLAIEDRKPRHMRTVAKTGRKKKDQVNDHPLGRAARENRRKNTMLAITQS